MSHLTFDNGFYDGVPLGVIPASVTHLTFSFDLENGSSTPLNVGPVPTSVTHLTVCGSTDQFFVPEMIPESVTHLVSAENRMPD
jgi:hypothetical protein